MKFILKMLFLLLFLVGCGGKKVSIEKQKTTEKERKELRKDSVFQKKVKTKTASFSFEKNKIFELELQSDKDSLGNSKKMTFQQIRSPTENTFIVEGGSIKLKIGSTDKQITSQKDSLNIENTKAFTSKKEDKSSEKEDFKKEEKKEAKYTLPLKMIFWIVIILVGIFIAWRFKLFKIFSAFKKYLNRN